MKRLLISILITIGIIAFLFTQISLGDLYNLLKNTDPFWAILGSTGYFLAVLLRALRYKWLIHSKDIPLLELLRISVFYHLALMVLPSKLGELSYPYLLNKISGMNITEGMASLIASRVYDFFVFLSIFLLASIGFQRIFKVQLFFIILLSALLLGLTLLLFFYMSDLLGLFSSLVGRVSRLAGSKNSKPFQWVQSKMHQVAEDFYAIKARKTYFRVTLISLASWITIFWLFYAFLRGFGMNISFLKVVFGSTIAVIANALPISGIGNWGTLEAGWAAGFLMVGLSKEKAISSGFGVHIVIFLICSMMALISWVSLNLPRKKQ
ncbi:MAG: lysylphosphatidylglycerol synthase transmembrane domain-containing protein [Thermodesulfobacteriota bacterium]